MERESVTKEIIKIQQRLKKKCPGVSEHARGVKLACFPFKVLNLAWLTSEAQTGTKETKITLKSQKKSKET